MSILPILIAVSIVGLSGCNWMGLPDVSVLKNRYPVVHYTPLPKAVAKRGAKGPAKLPLGPDGKPLREATITLEKYRPSTWVSLGEISKKAVGAIIVSEDWAFYQHHGYDPNQIKEAVNHDLATGKFARGASTITQQVAKNVFLDSEKNVARKVKELFLAVKLEETFKKPKILEVYLNVAEFGEGVYGIGPAAFYYFEKPASQLTAKEGAFLAMLLPSPKRYSVSFRQRKLTNYAHKTINAILGKMVQAKYLTEEERDAERAQRLSFETSSIVSADPAEDSAPDNDSDSESSE